MAVRTAEQNDKSKELENRKRPSARTAVATPTATSATQPSRGPVDAPGKRHRPPQPQEAIDKRMGERRGKQVGQKSFKNSPRGQH